MAPYKNFILIFSLCIGAYTPSAMGMSLRPRKQYSRAEHKTITDANKKANNAVLALSLATLAGYGIKAAATNYQGKPFNFPKKHKCIVALATYLSLALYFKEYRFAGNQAAEQQEGWATSAEGIRTEGKRLIQEVLLTTQQVLRRGNLPQNLNYAYFGTELTTDLVNFINTRLEAQQLTEAMTWEDLSEITKIKVTLYQTLVGQEGHPMANILDNHPEGIRWLQGMLEANNAGIGALYHRLQATNERCFTPAGNPFLPPA